MLLEIIPVLDITFMKISLAAKRNKTLSKTILINEFYCLAYIPFNHDIVSSHWLKVRIMGGSNRRGTAECGTLGSNRETKERRVYLAK